jgi:hypothetical protein
MADPTSPSPYSENKRFEPKVPIELQAPKSDEISLEELAKNNGMWERHARLLPQERQFAEQWSPHHQEPTPRDQHGLRSKEPCSTSRRTKLIRRRVNITVRLSSPLLSPPSCLADRKSFRTVFAGKDPSRGLALSSLKPEDCVPNWDDLDDKYKTVLNEWYTFFSKRYNIVGKVSTPIAQKL